MPTNGSDNSNDVVVMLGDDQVMRNLEELHPEALAKARKRIAQMPSRPSLIAQMPADKFALDRSDEIAIVGKLKD